MSRREIGAADVRALREAAGTAGDLAMVAICDVALDQADDSPEGYAAWAECRRVILDARDERDDSGDCEGKVMR